MNLWRGKYYSAFVLLLLLLSCKPAREELIIPEEDYANITTNQSIEISKYWTKDESFKIDQFIQRRGWPVVKTETGVRYYVYEQGSGELALPGQIALVNFEIRLLDADMSLCYSSEENGTQEFLITMDNIETGLHEAICYLRPGDKAMIILPHYLAHGLLGDMERIPPLSPVLYNIHLLAVKNN
jgi:FKBP-type peptidyl-prolyl cis-trans isomerase FkpA